MAEGTTDESAPFLTARNVPQNGYGAYGSLADNDDQRLESNETSATTTTAAANATDDPASTGVPPAASATTLQPGGGDVDNGNASGNANDGSSDDLNGTEESGNGVRSIGSLTRRLRCLFSAVTWPIAPLGTLVAFTLLWVLYTASSVDFRRTCSHPLHLYAVASLILVAYVPQHARVRTRLFNYSRERDGPIRPIRVRMYDQIFHTVCILYVYAGVTLVQQCHDDVINPEEPYPGQDPDLPTPPNTCAATCPNLYQALSIYVATLEMFTFALILPLLFIPCIYFWFLHNATADAEAMARLRGRFRDDSSGFRGNTVTTAEILDSLEHVRLVSKPESDAAAVNDSGNTGGGGDNARFVCVGIGGTSSDVNETDPNQFENTRECCICMCEFTIHDSSEAASDTANRVDEAPVGVAETNARLRPKLLQSLLGFSRSPSPDPGGTGNGNNESDNTENRSSGDDGSDRCQNIGAGQKERDAKDTIVRTKCGHVFHKDCMAGWIGGQWHIDQTTGQQQEQPSLASLQRRPAQQTCCPLCREDLRPGTSV